MEEWKDIQNYEGLYQVSNLGRIRSKSRYVEATNFKGTTYKIKRESKIIKPGDNGRGYLHVILSKNHKTSSKYLHRLVAEAFIPNPENLSDVHHKDGNPYNNSVDNLMWLSHADNLKQPERLEKVSISMKNFYSSKKETEILWTL